MSLRIRDIFQASLFAAALVACGDTTGPSPLADASSGGAGGAPNVEAGPDANGGAPPSDARPDNVPGDACGGDAVWTPASLTFKLTSTGGFVAPPPPDAGCTAGVGSTYDFTLPAATLEAQGCDFTGRHDTLVHLSPSDVGAVVAAVGALRTTCVKGCGADAPNATLTVRGSGVETTYTSNFYAGCPGSMDTPPFLPFDSFFQLESSLSEIISRACRSDAGPRDAGTCEMR
jgi:hypothetical protein